jgi:hypothetical protein
MIEPAFSQILADLLEIRDIAELYELFITVSGTEAQGFRSGEAQVARASRAPGLRAW